MTTYTGTQKQIQVAEEIMRETVERLTAWATEVDPDVRLHMPGFRLARMWNLKRGEVTDFVEFLGTYASAAKVIDHFGRATGRYRASYVSAGFRDHLKRR